MAPADNPSSVEGSTSKPAKKPRAKKKSPPTPPPGPKPSANGEAETRGRLGSDLRQRSVEWLLRPWFPSGMLSLLVGLPSIGKSTFVAHVMAQAGCSAILPGYEEDVEVSTLARMLCNGVNLRLVRFLDDRHYTLPRDKSRIAAILRGWEASLLVIDPIDSYMDEDLSENAGQDVRLMLESASWIARETGAAVIGVRHPGKDRTNIMPGSRQWRAVPRSIVELVSDGGTPPRLLIRHYKDSLGQDTKPREYVLAGTRGLPRSFQLLGEVDQSLNDLANVANDPGGRRKVLEAAKLIKHLFEQEEKPSVQDLVAQCRVLGIGEHARDEAKRLLSVVTSPLESGGKWVMFRYVKGWPVWLESADPPQA